MRRAIPKIATRDGTPITMGMTVWFFDVHDHAHLKSGVVSSIFEYGPEVKIPSGSYFYSRQAVWASKEMAEANGPPTEVYCYSEALKQRKRAGMAVTMR